MPGGSFFPPDGARLWSVEIKQPQLQIARHYTPLLPSPTTSVGGGGGGNGALRKAASLSVSRERGEVAKIGSKQSSLSHQILEFEGEVPR
jgi:hypothetical protein